MTDTTNKTNNGKGKPKKQRLELTWIGKDEELKLEPRILIEDPEKSYGDKNSENMLIHGDNLLALKALEQDYAGKVKCIYIDPPYNTGSAFEHYDDNLEHSIWLSLLKPRLELLKKLLSTNGSIWVSIDDNEAAYLRVLMDEIFGRNEFIATIIWEKRTTRENRRSFSFKHDYLIAFAKNKKAFESSMNGLPLTKEILARYKNPDNDSRGPWQSISALAQAGHATNSQFYTLVTPNGKAFDPPPGNCWRLTEKRMKEEIADNRVWLGKAGENVPRLKRYLNENTDDSLTPETIWYANDVGTNDSAKKFLNKLLKGDIGFDTPKPEGLIQRILQIASSPNDLVLDSFLGSGTTSAVAHKMNRKWIGIEHGEHANTLCLPRLKSVIENSDESEINHAASWQGGGGFRFYNLAPSLLRKDKYDNWVIDEKYNANMLAAAMCKHEGFRFSPHEELYWKQGGSTETDYIFVTTAFVTVEQLDKIHEEMSGEESLLICAKSFAPECEDRHPNITIKKIPQMILGKCEYGQENYDLNIIESTEETAEDQELTNEDDE